MAVNQFDARHFSGGVAPAFAETWSLAGRWSEIMARHAFLAIIVFLLYPISGFASGDIVEGLNNHLVNCLGCHRDPNPKIDPIGKVLQPPPPSPAALREFAANATVRDLVAVFEKDIVSRGWHKEGLSLSRKELSDLLASLREFKD